MRVGIAGAIGTGKSTAAQYLADKYQLTLFDADKYGHRLYSIFSPTFYQILRHFKTVNRKKIAKIVFSNHQKLELLNRITHPNIFKMISKELPNDAVIEATLFYQIQLDQLTDINILLLTKNEIIDKRLQKRGYNDKQIKDRKKAMPKFNKKNYDIVIENNGDILGLQKKLDRELLKYF